MRSGTIRILSRWNQVPDPTLSGRPAVLAIMRTKGKATDINPFSMMDGNWNAMIASGRPKHEKYTQLDSMVFIFVSKLTLK